MYVKKTSFILEFFYRATCRSIDQVTGIENRILCRNNRGIFYMSYVFKKLTFC